MSKIIKIGILVGAVVLIAVIGIAATVGNSNSPQELIVGKWVSVNTGSSFSFSEDGTCFAAVEGYGQNNATYKVEGDSLVMDFYGQGGTGAVLIWDQALAMKGGSYWYVSKDQLIIDGLICVREEQPRRF
jgi:hypothetical protein